MASESVKVPVADKQPVAEDALSDAAAYFKHGVVFNGDAFVDAASAVVSVYDHSFLYGDGVFEVIACRSGCLFAVEEHLDRLWASCCVLRIEPPVSRQRMRELVAEAIALNALEDGQVRLIVSRGEGYPRADPREATHAHLVIMTQDQPAQTYADYGARGLRVIIASTRRTPPICLDPRIKSNNYLNLIMAKFEAIAAGADDVILLDCEGHVAETPGGSVFALKGGALATPFTTHILASITRQTVLELARGGISDEIQVVEERAMTPYDLYAGDEVFIAGTGCGIAFVGEIDGRRIGGGEGAGRVASAVSYCYNEVLAGRRRP